MVAVCPATEPARLLASSPAIGHACSLTRIRVEAADGGRSFVSSRRLARVLRLPSRLAAFQPGAVSASSVAARVIRSVCSSFGAHRAPVTEAATAFAHGSLRASHAVCLDYSTLEPAICARKETDSENLSTTGRVLAESFVMRGDFFDTQTVTFGFYATSRHCIPRLSPRNSNPNTITANNGAAENCSARHGSCYSYSGVSRSSHLLS